MPRMLALLHIIAIPVLVYRIFAIEIGRPLAEKAGNNWQSSQQKYYKMRSTATLRCDKWAILRSGPTDNTDIDACQRTGLCRTPQGNDWKVFPAPIITYIKPNASATLARNRRLRKRTSRSTSPPRSRLESRTLRCGLEPMVDLIGRLSIER